MTTDDTDTRLVEACPEYGDDRSASELRDAIQEEAAKETPNRDRIASLNKMVAELTE